MGGVPPSSFQAPIIGANLGMGNGGFSRENIFFSRIFQLLVTQCTLVCALGLYYGPKQIRVHAWAPKGVSWGKSKGSSSRVQFFTRDGLRAIIQKKPKPQIFLIVLSVVCLSKNAVSKNGV